MKTHLCLDHPLRVSRRHALAGLLAFFTGRALGADLASYALPKSVAGIEIPSSAVARAAISLSRRACPAFLFNHCMRTFVFGALHERHHGRTYNAEAALVAAALHDLGLLTSYETAGKPFEVDSANAAEELALQNGAPAAVARLIWNAAAMHDMRWAIVEKQNPTVELVAAGAGADVVGPDEEIIPRAATDVVLAAFPRLGFKVQFAQLLTNHCKRKPLSQQGTWLDGYCRAAVPAATFPDPKGPIQSAPFSE